MRKIVLIFCLFLLCACTDHKEASEDNYRDALEDYLEKKFPVHCFVYRFPISAQENSKEHAILKNLEKHGILKLQEVREQDGRANAYSTKIIRVKRYYYDLSYQGSRYYFIDEEARDNDHRNFLGFGEAQLLSIDKATPYEINGQKLVNIRFTYAMQNTPAWAYDRELINAVRIVYPDVGKTMEKYGTNSNITELQTLILEDNRWRVR